MKNIMRYILSVATLVFASNVSAAPGDEPKGPVKPVVIVNDSLSVEGEVNATIEGPIEVEGVLGVDVLSTPDDTVGVEEFSALSSRAGVRGDVPVVDYYRAFNGVLQELRVQLLANGILHRDSGHPNFFPVDISCRLTISVHKDGVEKVVWVSDITQSNDQGASGAISLPNLDLRDGGSIHTLLELTGGGSAYPATPVCILDWVANGTS